MNLKIISILALLIVILLSCIYRETYEYFDCDRKHFVPFEYIRSYRDIKELEEITRYVTSILDSKNIIYWISRGILLGAVRHGRTIPWTSSLNSEICITIDSVKSLVDSFIKIEGYSIEKMNDHYRVTKQQSKGEVKIYVFEMNKNMMVHSNLSARNKYLDEYFPIDELYPLRRYNYSTFTIKGPNNPNKILYRLYGEKWNKEGIHNNNTFLIEDNMNRKPYMWVYWDNPNGDQVPVHISLCHESIVKNCSDSFNVVFLNKHLITRYIPELNELPELAELDMTNIILAHKVDLYRVILLYKYGGIYLDSDTIVLRDPIEVHSKLREYDYVGFGCTGDKCKNGYMRPSNGIMASRPYSILMKNVFENLLNKFRNRNGKTFAYFEVGKYVIWDCMKQLVIEEDYKYFHYDNRYDGTRDKNGTWMTNSILFSDIKIEYEKEDEMLFLIFYNSNMTDKLKSMSKKELLDSGMNISRFYRKALGLSDSK